jgi:hypothetical protein
VKARPEGRSVVIPFGEIRGTSLARLLKDSRGKVSTPEAWALALWCLLEGQLEAARGLLKGIDSPVPEKYWDYARAVVGANARPGGDLPPREQEARNLYYSAEQMFEDCASTAEAAQKHAHLLKDFSETVFVGRNRAFILLRSQAGKEYFFLPEDMTALGAFSLVKNLKTESCYTSDSDVELGRMNERHVELAFSALPGTEYRLWVYLGACCAETFAFYYQATDLIGTPSKDAKDPGRVEPGSTSFMPVRPSLTSLKRTHASHGGPKAPDRWEWVGVPLPKFVTSGPKKVRFFSDQKGFSIAYAFVSAQKSSPPGEPDIKANERLRSETPGCTIPTRLVPRSSPSVVTCRLGGTSPRDGLKQINPKTTVVVNDGTESYCRPDFANPALGGEGHYVYFRVDPRFVPAGTQVLEITVVAKRLAPDKSAGMTLYYEAAKGYTGPRGWWTIPQDNRWHENTWKITDANFVGQWGWNFRFDAISSPNEFLIKEVRVTKNVPPTK